MRPLLRDIVVFASVATACFFVSAGGQRILRSPSRGLPYHDDFGEGGNSEWVAYGGNWNLHSGMMVNESNERGANLVSGSPYWTNYAVDADMSMSDVGDAGILARVSDAEPGVDSYSGIYVGLRARDQSLIMGIADHGWTEIVDQPLPYPIVANVWYHIRLEIRGCNLRIASWPDGKSEVVERNESLTACPERGMIGLRSYDSGGQWKNVSVTYLDKGGS